jgi:ACS family hexuronate transporter-like MFS transporter
MTTSSNDTTTHHAPDIDVPRSNMRWVVCGLLFLATTINYMDRSVFSLIEPKLHDLAFMGWSNANPAIFNNNFGNVLISFQIVYGIGFLIAGRIIDKLGTKAGYALAIGIWALASISHVLVGSVLGFCVARAFLGLGESGNFPAALKAISEWFPTEERALATGLFNSGTNFAALIAPVLIPFVTYKYGWHAAFLTTGSMGVCWLILWLFFPYEKMRARHGLEVAHSTPYSMLALLRTRRAWAFIVGKGLTDGVWWFYLFWLPKYFHENYGVDMLHLGPPIITIYFASSIGSICGGWLSGIKMKAGHTVNYGRKFAMLVCALAVQPLILVPSMHTHFAGNMWPAVALIGLAAAAHQGWSANLFSTPSDMFSSTAVSTVVGLGGAGGALGGAIFTYVVKHVWTSHQLSIFIIAALAYPVALGIFQFLVPRLYIPSLHMEEPA